MSKEVTVSLGGEKFTVKALTIGPSKVWREKLAIPFSTLARTLTSYSEAEIDRPKDIATLVKEASGVLLGSVDEVLDLLFSYSPELAARREWIEAHAYDEEALRAFAEVLKLAFPFGVLLEVVRGQTGSKISPNSSSPNGTSSLPASGPIPKKAKRG